MLESSARVNVARAQRSAPVGGSPLDVAYLSQLSGDAVETAFAATLAAPSPAGAAGTSADSLIVDRCRAARRIRGHWGPASRAAADAEQPGAWRRWNAGESRALSLAARNETALRTVQHESCAAARDAGIRMAPARYR